MSESPFLTTPVVKTMEIVDMPPGGPVIDNVNRFHVRLTGNNLDPGMYADIYVAGGCAGKTDDPDAIHMEGYLQDHKPGGTTGRVLLILRISQKRGEIRYLKDEITEEAAA